MLIALTSHRADVLMSLLLAPEMRELALSGSELLDQPLLRLSVGRQLVFDCPKSSVDPCIVSLRHLLKLTVQCIAEALRNSDRLLKVINVEKTSDTFLNLDTLGCAGSSQMLYPLTIEQEVLADSAIEHSVNGVQHLPRIVNQKSVAVRILSAQLNAVELLDLPLSLTYRANPTSNLVGNALMKELDLDKR